MDEQLYIKNDLIDYVDGDIEELLREATDSQFRDSPGTRFRAMEAVLPDDVTIESARSGTYSGEQILAIECGGYYWVRHGYYGSCSVCDAYRSDPFTETERICRGAYCFETVDDAVSYLEETDDIAWRRGNLKEDGIECVERLRNPENADR